MVIFNSQFKKVIAVHIILHKNVIDAYKYKNQSTQLDLFNKSKQKHMKWLIQLIMICHSLIKLCCFDVILLYISME